MSGTRSILTCAGAAALLVAGVVAADARPMTPAEQRDAPYSGLIKPCEDPSAIGFIKGAFADREDEYWHSGLTIVAMEGIREVGNRADGLDYIPRRYCTAKAIMSDQKIRTVNYTIVEAGGSIGYTDNVEWCVTGLDRENSFAPYCKMERP